MSLVLTVISAKDLNYQRCPFKYINTTELTKTQFRRPSQGL